MKSRAVAALIVKEVIQHGRSLNTAIPSLLPRLSQESERGFTQELSYGVMRWYPRLEAIAGQLLKKPLKSKDSDIYALLLCGLYQLIYMRVPEHAAVGETAAVAKVFKKPWATGVINGSLRNFLRHKDELLTQADQSDEARYAYPGHLLSQIRQDWPNDWQVVVEASNQRPPMFLRVNILKVPRDDYLALLRDEGLCASPFLYCDSGIVLEKAVDVTKLPHFSEGWVSVQDGGAQVVAQLLELQPQQKVLDACAAPGGKACHILETEQNLAEVQVLDKEDERQQRTRENLTRLGLHAKVLVGDACHVADWWDGEQFDRVLLDAPCSASGVIRRHPDIKQLRSREDFEKLAQTQAELLRALWPLLKPGGILLYATCSICHLENEKQILRFLDNTADAQELQIEQPWGRAMSVGRQILPGDGNMDGFFYARLKKR